MGWIFGTAIGRRIALRLGLVLALLPAAATALMAASAGENGWSGMGEGLNGDVYALISDANGTVYAGGSFTASGGAALNHVAVWDGKAWSPLGEGVTGDVYALALDNQGILYAGGAFTGAGGGDASRVARWNGKVWSPLGTGVNAEVYSLAVSSRGDLYAAGSFTSAQGLPVNRIAKWDGSVWSDVGGGTNGRVNVLKFDAGGNLYAGGSFTVPAPRIARWDGAAWSPVGNGVSNTVRALAFDGIGNLYAGGVFINASGATANHIAEWDGAYWHSVGNGTNNDVYALVISRNGDVFVGGDFISAGGWPMSHITEWDGNSWSSLDGGLSDTVRSLVIDPSDTLYAGGSFGLAGNLTVNHAAAWSSVLPHPIPTSTPLPPQSIVLTTDNPLFCPGQSLTVTVRFSEVDAMYGYQFEVTYDPQLATATGTFNNSFFDTRANVFIPPGWNAACADGVCRFAASLLDPASGVSGSGNVAQVTLSGVGAGSLDLKLNQDVLSDRDGHPVAHAAYPLHVNECGFASLSGTVELQGRDTPGNAGKVTLTDSNGLFGPYIASYDAVTGAFHFENVKVIPGGSTYQVDATHGLYLANRIRKTLMADKTYVLPKTRLLGGDANNDGVIDLGDLTCIGGSFGGSAVICGTDGSSDVNMDGKVDIRDLVLAAGNYGQTAPGDW